ncbi:MAG: ATP-binding cassette domain-containing protein, partial [Ruminococcus sp.]|nr:ATP-binding cassette domain-containing protein [Ruminococcus sp.]
ILGITDLLGRKPKQLSGGQRQRVAIGRAIVRVPKVFLMDEPLSNLDAKLRNQMRAEIILLREKIRTTFVYVTHDQTEAMTLGDRIVIMKDGYVMQVGTPQELFNHPANLFVAGFIGTPQMNFFDVELKKTDKGYKALLLGEEFNVPEYICAELDKRDSVPTEVVLGVRPENLIVDASGYKGIRASIKVTEMMGSELHIHAECVDGKKIILKVQIADLTEEEQQRMLECKEVLFTIRERTINLFDKADGRNLAVENAVAVPEEKKAATVFDDDVVPEDGKKKKKKK